MQPTLTILPDVGDALDPAAGWDALVVIAGVLPPRLPEPLELACRQLLEVDRTAASATRLIPTPGAPGRRLILAPTGPLSRDHDDVRRVADAAAEGVRLARDAGAVRPVVVLRGVPRTGRYDRALEVAGLAALGATWEPLEAREALGEAECEPIAEIGLVVPEGTDGERVRQVVAAVEQGRRLARDLCGANPERLTPRRFAHHCQERLAPLDVDVEVLTDVAALGADYPLLMAVARASMSVPRHHPCVIRLVWQGEGPVQRTLLLAGKGLTYDTGGADLKTGGHMAGMSRDKGGAAAVAGFVLSAAALRPPGLRVVALIGAVRNSIGPDSFVTDEIVVGHSGARVRIGNTDAEGRLVLADLLSHLRREALDSTVPTLLSVATLTGHAALAVGPYTALVDNGPARDLGVSEALAAAGEAWGDPCERSSLRREDWEFVQPRTRADDVLSCNNKPSSQTPRGHQFPMAFLQIAAGLESHGGDSDRPLAHVHVDIAGSGVTDEDWQHGTPTATPVVALAACYLVGEG